MSGCAASLQSANCCSALDVKVAGRRGAPFWPPTKTVCGPGPSSQLSGNAPGPQCCYVMPQSDSASDKGRRKSAGSSWAAARRARPGAVPATDVPPARQRLTVASRPQVGPSHEDRALGAHRSDTCATLPCRCSPHASPLLRTTLLLHTHACVAQIYMDAVHLNPYVRA